MTAKTQTAAHYFPNYHIEPRNEKRHGRNWTEWELMKCARPRFPGHNQPKVPLWGYEDEADPAVMAKKIDAAADHGIDAFIFDWYWYEGPFLERCLNEGFLHAANRNRLRFALMWANHDWRNFHPGGRDTAGYPTDFPWSTTRDTVGIVWNHIIEHYFTQPNYWRVNGLPYFSIYAMNRFILQMGGVEACADVFALFREKAKTAGLPGVHLNGIWFDILDSHPACSACPQSEWVTRLGLNSYTSSTWAYTGKVWFDGSFPRVDYRKSADEYLEIARKAQSTLPAPYYPVVTVGWDSSPRCIQSETYEACGYPWMPVMEATPDDFAYAVRCTLENLSGRPEGERIFLLNAWNEWTEGSYLEPDTRFGTAFLEQLKREKDTMYR